MMGYVSVADNHRHRLSLLFIGLVWLTKLEPLSGLFNQVISVLRLFSTWYYSKEDCYCSVCCITMFVRSQCGLTNGKTELSVEVFLCG